MQVCRASYSSYQTEKSLDQEKTEIKELGLDYARCEQKPEPKELPDAEILLINSSFPVTAELLAEWPGGKLIITTTSGFDHIDLAACERHNVRVVRTPRSRARRVSEHTLGLITGLLRDLPGTGQQLKNGKWNRTEAFSNSKELHNQVIGILGYGEIGSRVSDLLKPLVDSPILVHDPLKRNAINQASQLEYVEPTELFGRSTVVTLHTDLNPATDKLIKPETLRLMPEKSYLVNTSRGQVIDQAALLEALDTNKLAGAGLDVFAHEPPKEKRFFENYKLLLTPHAAGFGPGLLSDLRSEITQTLECLLTEKQLPNPVSPRSEAEYNKLQETRKKILSRTDE